MMIVGFGVWVGPVSMVKMKVLQFQQLVLVPIGSTFSNGNILNFAISLVFKNSYVGGCQSFKMANYCHLEVWAMAVKTYKTFVTQMVAKHF